MSIAADLSPEAYQQATAFLSALDDDWARHIALVGPCALQVMPQRAPYEALIRAVSHQQVHAKAGDAMLNRLLALHATSDFPSPEHLLSVDAERHRACGFSTAKVTAIRGIAQATLDGIVPHLAQAQSMDDVELIERLITLRGIGRWTVEMFLVSTLGRSDILAVDDFGVREGYRLLKGLDKAPTPKQLREIGEGWRPHRTVAMWYLWQRPARY